MKAKKLIMNVTKVFSITFFLIQTTSCMMMHVVQHSDNSMNGRTIKDPVCGRVITDTSKSIKYEYETQTYYFDTEECLKVFQKNPEKFATGMHTHHSGIPFMVGGVIMGAMMIFMVGYWMHRGW